MDKDNKKSTSKDEISRKEAIKKIGHYGKYTALTALGTYLILMPKSAQASSPSGSIPPPPDGFSI